MILYQQFVVMHQFLTVAMTSRSAAKLKAVDQARSKLSSSTTNLFQVLYHFLGFIILAQPFLLCGFCQSNPCFYPTQTILIYSNQSLTLGDRLWSSEQNEIESKKSRTCRLFQFVVEFWRFTNNQQEVSCLVKSCVHTFSQWWHQHFHVRTSNWHNWSHFRSFWFFCF